MIEAEVHQQLRAFLRAQGEAQWPHHLTMARLVARALRVGRSALMQTGPPAGLYGRYRLSYLMPLLLWPESAVLVVPDAVKRRLIQVEIPRLRQWMGTSTKAIQVGDRWPDPHYHGILITSPEAWLADRLHQGDRIPLGLPTVIDPADDLETWARQSLTVTLRPGDWDALMWAFPADQEAIRDTRVQLTQAVFYHPENPYDCHPLNQSERDLLFELGRSLGVLPGSPAADPAAAARLPAPWPQFWQTIQQPWHPLWANPDRDRGYMTLACGPLAVADALRPIWQQQPVVIVGGALDVEADAPTYRQTLGLGDLTCLKFAPHRQHDAVQLYIPDRLPLPNTPHFQPALLQELRHLLYLSAAAAGFTVILVQDTPLKQQVATTLAAEFGSRVQVEQTSPDENGILVTGWEFWRSHQGRLPIPHLLMISTLPLPSLEHPLVAARVAYHKRQRQDWFRLFLLPEAMGELQRAIAPVRESQGVVALLDNRVNHRSYGTQIVNALNPAARTSYIDDSFFPAPDQPLIG